MKEVYFEITQWPEGQSLDITVNDRYISIAGVHGGDGDVGYTVKRFKVNIDFLKETIAKLCEEEK